MKPTYIKEQKRYTFSEIKEFLGLDREQCEKLIKKLKYFGVLKIVKARSEEKELTRLQDEIEILEDKIGSNNIFYVFKYVGVITIENKILICYPKYINSTTEPKLEMKQLLKVIKKYNSEEQIMDMYNGEGEERSFNLLSIILFLINDYYINGLYSNSKDIIEINGEGDILWDKTINETYALINEGKPYYLDVYTERVIEDDMDYFNKLHRYILNECFKFIDLSDIAILFDIEVNDLYDGELEDFGEDEYILYRLDCEINTQFISKKQIILKTMYAYIANRKLNTDDIGISLYGTSNFNLVWEKVCGFVLDNKINSKLNNLPLKLSLKYKDKRSMTLGEIIEKPKWQKVDNDGEIISLNSNKTLKPDSISIVKLGNDYGFIIFDAKYYTIYLDENNVYNYPGVADVTKEYLYQLAYRDFIESSGYKFIANVFLFPSEGKYTKFIGQAKMSMLSAIGLSNITLLKLPTSKVYDLYLNNSLFTMEEILTEINLNKWKFELQKVLIKDINNIIEENVNYNNSELNLSEVTYDTYDTYEDLQYNINILSGKLSNIIRNSSIDNNVKIKEVNDILNSVFLINEAIKNELLIDKIKSHIYKEYIICNEV